MSCQFTFQYVCGTEEEARQTLRNVADSLKEGGNFIMTIPDWEVIIDRLVEERTTERIGQNEYLFRVGGQKQYLEFMSDAPLHEFLQRIQTSPFGNRYIYHQEGAIDRVPEYMVEPNAFARLCSEEGLRILHEVNFLDFEKDTISSISRGLDLGELRRRMRVKELGVKEHRDIVGLYKAMVLQARTKRPRLV